MLRISDFCLSGQQFCYAIPGEVASYIWRKYCGYDYNLTGISVIAPKEANNNWKTHIKIKNKHYNLDGWLIKRDGHFPNVDDLSYLIHCNPDNIDLSGFNPDVINWINEQYKASGYDV